jgi:hypothetical protein
VNRREVKLKIIEQNLIDYKCAICKIDSWNDAYISLHLDHIDGNNSNHDLQNLRFLCPNCHSQTDTYAGKNNKIKYSIINKKISDGDLLTAMKVTNCPAHAFDLVGLARSNNYQRIYRLAKIHNMFKHMSTEDKNSLRRKALDESKIKKTNYGWVQLASEILQMTPQAAGRWMRKNYPDFYYDSKIRK